MDGRVKTLHPRVHGGILMRGAIDDADLDAHRRQAPSTSWSCNLYPFEQTLREDRGRARRRSSRTSTSAARRMLRTAAKNHDRVTVVCDPTDYGAVLAEHRARGRRHRATRGAGSRPRRSRTPPPTTPRSRSTCRRCRRRGEERDAEREPYPRYLTLAFERAYALRYGENPHQTRRVLPRARRASPARSRCAESLGGGRQGARRSTTSSTSTRRSRPCASSTSPAAVVVKHTNPCGVATARRPRDRLPHRARGRPDERLRRHRGPEPRGRRGDRARSWPRRSSSASSRPAFAPGGARDPARQKKPAPARHRARGCPADHQELDVQARRGRPRGAGPRRRPAPGEVETPAKVVTKRAPTAAGASRRSSSAWRVCKHVKSNAIVLARRRRTVGVGAGQMSRVESVRIACAQGRRAGAGARCWPRTPFFPFPDGLELGRSSTGSPASRSPAAA